MINVIVTRYSHEPPPKPLNLNGILFNHWLNVQTGEKRRWRNGKWEACKAFSAWPDGAAMNTAKPRIVCLCGSTRFKDKFVEMSLKETLAGKIVLTIGCDMRTDDEIFGSLSKEQFENIKAQLDELHLRKIDLADEVLILNVGGYIGESTNRELAYAKKHKKMIRYLEPAREKPQQ